MTKEKKRGFWSWLGLGRNKEQESVDEQATADTSASPTEAVTSPVEDHQAQAPAQSSADSSVAVAVVAEKSAANAPAPVDSQPVVVTPVTEQTEQT
ncbi:MAG TPA: hypothetical protein DCF88_07625, partial [Plesiomonas shigelloides]|nr:hypothetical protein [Plesiomonas shigelloides]